MIDSDALLQRIDELSESRGLGELYMGTLSIATLLYGSSSPQVKAVESVEGRVNVPALTSPNMQSTAQQNLKGMLQSFRAEVKAGLVTSIQAEAQGEILADFVTMAKQAIGDNQKDVAAVLSCAALEDALKRYGEANGLDVEDKEMAQVIGALKSAGLVKGAQGKLLNSYTTIRNKVFHAEWDKVDSADIKSVIGFTEGFLLTRF